MIFKIFKIITTIWSLAIFLFYLVPEILNNFYGYNTMLHNPLVYNFSPLFSYNMFALFIFGLLFTIYSFKNKNIFMRKLSIAHAVFPIIIFIY